MNFENYSETFEDVKLFHPDAVFINLGGNSITTKTKPSKLAENRMDIVKELNKIGVQKVYVAKITERGKFKPENLINSVSLVRELR